MCKNQFLLSPLSLSLSLFETGSLKNVCRNPIYSLATLVGERMMLLLGSLNGSTTRTTIYREKRERGGGVGRRGIEGDRERQSGRLAVLTLRRSSILPLAVSLSLSFSFPAYSLSLSPTLLLPYAHSWGWRESGHQCCLVFYTPNISVYEIPHERGGEREERRKRGEEREDTPLAMR